MSNASRTRQVSLCGESLQGLMHTCAFVDSRDEQYDFLLPFLREGLECGSCLLTVVNPAHREAHRERLARAGMPPDTLVADKRLLELGFEDTYLAQGCLSAERMLGMLEAALDEARAAGFAALRGFGEMDWALSGLPAIEQLVEYEARVNLLAPKLLDPLVCVYDVNRFGGQVIMDILSTHPKVIRGGRIHDNPYYLPPEAFLRHLAAREQSAPAATSASAPPA